MSVPNSRHAFIDVEKFDLKFMGKNRNKIQVNRLLGSQSARLPQRTGVFHRFTRQMPSVPPPNPREGTDPYFSSSSGASLVAPFQPPVLTHPHTSHNSFQDRQLYARLCLEDQIRREQENLNQFGLREHERRKIEQKIQARKVQREMLLAEEERRQEQAESLNAIRRRFLPKPADRYTYEQELPKIKQGLVNPLTLYPMKITTTRPHRTNVATPRPEPPLTTSTPKPYYSESKRPKKPVYHAARSLRPDQNNENGSEKRKQSPNDYPKPSYLITKPTLSKEHLKYSFRGNEKNVDERIERIRDPPPQILVTSPVYAREHAVPLRFQYFEKNIQRMIKAQERHKNSRKIPKGTPHIKLTKYRFPP